MRMVFTGAGLWNGPLPHLRYEWTRPPAVLGAAIEDIFPTSVPFARLPFVGEHVRLPDEDSYWIVERVLHDYAGGLSGAPEPWVVLTPAP